MNAIEIISKAEKELSAILSKDVVLLPMPLTYTPEQKFDLIWLIVCNALEVDIDCKEKGRPESYADARHLAMWYMREMIAPSLNQIAKFFNQHHTTVLYALDRIRGSIEVKDPSICIKINLINEEFKQHEA